MSYRVSKERYIPLNASIREDDELFDDNVDKNTSSIRRTLLILITAPSDWHILLNEWIQSIDLDAKAYSFAQPLGHSLTFLLYVIRLLQDNLIRPESYKIASNQDAFDLSRSEKLREYEYLNRYSVNREANSTATFYASFLSGVSKFFNLLTAALLIVNLGLTYQFFFGHFRSYSLFSSKERPVSKHVTKRSLRNLNDEYLENIYNGSLWSMLKYIFRGSLTADEKTDDDEIYYSLEKWVPSKFTTHFFACFCPTGVFFLLLCDISFTTAIPVVLHQIILHYMVIDRYEERLVDEAVIHQALMTDYEAKVVKPYTNKMMQDVQVDATTYGEGYVRFWPAISSSKSPIFKTHSVMGDTILEKFNSRTQEFEDVVGAGESHNLIMETPHFYPTCPYHNAMECRSSPRYHKNISGPGKMSTSSGFYSPYVYTASGMSSPLHAGGNSPIHLGSSQLHHQRQSPSMGQHLKRKSTSPLRRSVTPNDA
ncbi:hypothetical protein HG536_0A02970 [Torulaspora globosa]|uniref:Nuclear rim protein 1 n=1 Tax=Torulaspora globosa TaxID=48254 RepID=A0A7G3ZAE4_9SACH|nr:uncharacterized protein HG536_0A02970 [Torulaspora globosa]QLL30480.1 hypothetical protein HG536_0A02970 [Torulaspora globosa]